MESYKELGDMPVTTAWLLGETSWGPGWQDREGSMVCRLQRARTVENQREQGGTAEVTACGAGKSQGDWGHVRNVDPASPELPIFQKKSEIAVF